MVISIGVVFFLSGLYGFLQKEKCFWLATNEGSDSIYNIAVAINQFAGCSKKYFGTSYAELMSTVDPV